MPKYSFVNSKPTKEFATDRSTVRCVHPPQTRVNRESSKPSSRSSSVGSTGSPSRRGHGPQNTLGSGRSSPTRVVPREDRMYSRPVNVSQTRPKPTDRYVPPPIYPPASVQAATRPISPKGVIRPVSGKNRDRSSSPIRDFSKPLTVASKYAFNTFYAEKARADSPRGRSPPAASSGTKKK